MNEDSNAMNIMKTLLRMGNVKFDNALTSAYDSDIEMKYMDWNMRRINGN